MLKNYLRVAIRVIRRNPGYSAINIVGLSLGLACCVLIALFVREEWSYDSFHRNADDTYRLYRVEHRVRSPLKQSEAVMAPLAPAIGQQVPGIKHLTRVARVRTRAERADGQFPVEIVYGDPAFLDVFDFGAGRSVLEDPGSVVITESTAARIFGDTDVATEQITFSSGESFGIAAVIPDPPTNSSLKFDLLAPYEAWPQYAEATSTWDSFNTTVFVVLEEGTSPGAVEGAIAPILRSNYGETIDLMIERGWWADRDDTFHIRMQSLRDVHLTPDVDAFVSEVSDPRYSYILLGIGLAVLMIACANFMTMAIGRSVVRAQEVGMRKAVGASRAQLAFQFWGEAILLSGIAAGLGLALADTFLPVFNRLSEKELVFDIGADLWVLIALALTTGTVAGSYPATFLSRMNPVAVLKGGEAGRQSMRFHRAIIVAQFVISIAMTTATLIMLRQMDFVADRDLGFDSEEVMVVSMMGATSSVEDTQPLYAERVGAIPGVIETSASSSAFGGSWSRTVLAHNDVNHIVYRNFIEPSFLETMGIELLQGRNLSREFESDPEHSVLVNEAFVEAFGWEDNPIGQFLPRWEDVQVVGVVEDFNHLSLHQAVPPTMLHMSMSMGGPNYTMVRFRGDQAQGVLSGLERAWSEVSPGTPFQVEFLDQRLQQLYESERRWQEVITYAAGFAILISCLGLFGVATIATSRRRKEIGVRKSLGASVSSLAVLMSRDFARLVVVAFVVSAPISYLVMDRWLDTFAYRAPFSATSYLIAGGAAFFVAMLTVSYQAVSAASADPTESLRYE